MYLFKRLEHIYRTYPNKNALISSSTCISYNTLKVSVNELINQINTRHTKPSPKIAVALPPSPNLIISILSIWASGGVYIPIDLNLPKKRVSQILLEAKVDLIITETFTRKFEILDNEIDKIYLDLVNENDIKNSDSYPIVKNNLAYIFFTSGTTGLPNGVQIEHSAFENFLLAFQDILKLKNSDILYSVTNISFDISLLEFFLPLTVGGSVCFSSKNAIKDRSILKSDFKKFLPTIVQATPSLWNILIDDDELINTYKPVALCGGEALKQALASKILPQVKSLWNFYGPTETTIWSSVFKITKKNLGKDYPNGYIPIGKPILNTVFHILPINGENKNTGELCIGGAGVSIGYLNASALNNKKFISNSFFKEQNPTKLFRTGDHVQQLPNGTFCFLNRLDHQVKLLGHRIELGEIERGLVSHPSINDAIVKVETEKTGIEILVAFCITTNDIADNMHLSHIKIIYDNIYQLAKQPTKRVWTNSYTGLPFESKTLNAFFNEAFEHIPKKDSHILEIGFGEGQFMQHLLPYCNSYTGIELSEHALDNIREKLDKNYSGKLKLYASDALEFLKRNEQLFDTVILHSVIQYFPSEDYFRELMKLLLNKSNTTFIYLGDIRNLKLQKKYYKSLILYNNSNATVKEINEQIEIMEEMEDELFISPDYFYSIQNNNKINVKVLAKNSGCNVEMDLFRYDVLIKIGQNSITKEFETVHWVEFKSNAKNLAELLKDYSDTPLLIQQIPDDRVIFKAKKNESVIKTLIESTKQLGYHYELHIPQNSKNYFIDMLIYKQHLNEDICIYDTENYTNADYFNKPSRDGLESILTTHLESILPNYMIPSKFVFLKKFPTTVSGKIDRNALYLPKNNFTEKLRIEHDNSLNKESILNIFKDILNDKNLKSNDKFTDKGGSSLKVLRALAQLQFAFNKKITLKQFYDNSSANSMWKLLANNSVHISNELPVSSQDNQFFDISEGQEAIFHACHSAKMNTGYNNTYVINVPEDLNIALFEEALIKVVERHELLRSIYKWNGSAVKQSFIEKPDNFFFYHGKVDNQTIDVRAQRIHNEPFDLNLGPLFRVHIFLNESNDHIVLFSIHHIIWDHWSSNIMLYEWFYIYFQINKGKKPNLRPLILQYKDFVSFEKQLYNGTEGDSARNFWKQQFLKPLEYLQLPLDFIALSNTERECNEINISFSDETVKQIQQMSRLNDVSEFVICISMIQVILYKYSGVKVFALGVPVANRTQLRFQEQIGYFLNVVPFICEIEPSETIADLCLRTNETLINSFDKSGYPLRKLLHELDFKSNQNNHPLFNTIVSWEDDTDSWVDKINNLFGNSENIVIAEQPSIYPKFDIAFLFRKKSSGIELKVEYNTNMYSPERVSETIKHFKKTLEEFFKTPNLKINGANLLYREEYDKIRYTFNDTEKNIDNNSTLISLFKNQTLKTPFVTALVDENTNLTYQELHKQSEQVAANLAHKYHIKPGQKIILLHSRKVASVVMMLGILKTRCSYVPVDFTTPESRVRLIMKICNSAVVISEQTPIWALQNEVILFSNLLKVNSYPNNLIATPLPNDIAYTIFTSGTTGNPKAISIEHRGIVNTVLWRMDYYGFDVNNNILQYASFSFDTSVADIFSALSSGSCLVIPDEKSRTDLHKLSLLFYKHKITNLVIVPSIYSLLLEHPKAFHYTKQVVLAGDQFSESLVEKHFERFPEVELFNEYGPTENSVCTTAYQFRPDQKNVLIGRPIWNTKCFILDNDLKLAPIGYPGNLFITGRGLCNGYEQIEEENYTKFIKIPDIADAPLYKTGDIGRWLQTGDIEFFGRDDFQLKIRGFRVDLTEIENHLLRIPNVFKAVVLPKEDRATLVAFVQSANDIDATIIRNTLRKSLPEFLIPNEVVILKLIPLNKNGKIDRKVLLRGYKDTNKPTSYTHSTIERSMLEYWRKVFNNFEIQPTDEFLNIGGHSILALQLVQEINQQMSVDVKISDLFNHPSPYALAQYIGDTQKKINIQNSIEKLYPTESQITLWELINQFNTGWLSNVFIGWEGVGELPDLEKAKNIISFLLNKHTALRLGFDNKNIKEHKLFLKKTIHENIIIHDCKSNDNKEVMEKINELLFGEFDLKKDIFLKGHLVKLHDKWIFILLTHHLVCDGQSAYIIAQEFSKYYKEGLPSENTSDHYREYLGNFSNVAYISKRGEHLSSWKAFISNKPLLKPKLPYKKIFDSKIDVFAGGMQQLNISEKHFKKIETKCTDLKVTLASALIFLASEALSKWLSQQTFVIAIQTNGRNLPYTNELVGNLIGSFPLLFEGGLIDSRDKRLIETFQSILFAQENSYPSFKQVIFNNNYENSDYDAYLFNTLINVYNYKSMYSDSLFQSEFLSPFLYKYAKLPLHIVFYETNKTCVVEVIYQKQKISDLAVGKLLDSLSDIISEYCETL